MAHSATPRLPAPSPDAIDALRRPDGRVLLLGESFERLRQLTEALLQAGCRIELVGLPRSAGESPLCICHVHLIVFDAIHLSRASADAVHAVVTAETSPPLVAISPHRGVRHRVTGAHCVIAYLAEDGSFADSTQVVRDILSTWSGVRPLGGPGELRVDRMAQRATVRGREITLRPFDFRLLRALVERGARGCSIDELRAAASNGRIISSRRAVIAVRQGLERLRTLFRRTELTLISGSDGRYRLTTQHAAAGDRPA